jgi:subtilisin-like proprotein convertase family protein
MQETTTLNKLKGFLFKMVPMVVILNIFFSVSFAQQKGAVVAPPQGKFNQSVVQNFGATDVPSINEAFEKNRIAQKNGATELTFKKPVKNNNPSITSFTDGNYINTNNAPTSNFVDAVCVFNGGLVTGDPVLGGPRPFRSGVSSSCAAPGACGTPFGTTGYLYDTIRMKNTTCLPQCVTVNYVANAGGGDVFVTAYRGSFSTANICTNRIADGGSSSISGGAAVNFSFNLAVDETVIFVINGAQPNTQCPSYTMTVTGLDCSAPPVCQAPTASVLSQVLLPGAPITVFNQNFDGTIPPAGWPVQNLSAPLGVTGWAQTNATVFPPNSGPGKASANFNNTAGTGTISNWMFTPNVTLKNGDVFRFWTRTTTGQFPDRLQLRMSTNGASVNVGATATSVGDFTTVLQDINPTYTGTGYPTAWTQFTTTLSGLPPAGISGRLAFRYFVENGGPTGANSDFIGIDDAVYTTSGISTPTTCTGSTANLKVDITGGVGPYTVVLNTVPPTTPITVTNYNSGENIPVTPLVTTQYTLTSVSSSACCIGTGNSGTPTIVVSLTPVTPINVTALPTTAVCLGDGVLMTVSNGIPITPLTLTQTTGLTMIANSLIGCAGGNPRTHTDNSYWRVYDLAPLGIPTPTFSINSIQLGVQLANAAGVGTTQPITVRLYTQTGAAFPGGTRTQVASQTYNVADIALATYDAVFTLPVPVPSNATVVVEVFTPNGQIIGNQFFLGFNALAETTPSFINATACGINTPTTTIAVGIPQFRPHINIVGQYGGGATVPVGWTFLWTPATGLSNPTSNPVAASPMTTTLYTVVGTAPNGCNTSANYRVVVNQPPAVTAQPISVTNCDRTSASFSVTATGTGPLTYQWQEQVLGVGAWNNLANGAPYSGATSPTLTINPVAAIMNGNRYRCIVTGICNPAFTSNPATLTVNNLPVLPITPVGPVCGGVAGINGVALTVGSAAPPVPGSVTTNSGPISIAIPDNNQAGTSANLTVAGIPANATITGVRVNFTIPHTFTGDLVMALRAPNNDVLNLDYYLSGTFGGVTTGFTNTTIGSAGVTALSAGVNPWTGLFRADGQVAATANGPAAPTGFVVNRASYAAMIANLSAANANGVYTLAIYDGGAIDIGTLNSWSITVDYTTPGVGTGAALSYVWSPTAGLYTNAGATIPYTGQNLATVYAAPTAYTTYTVTGTNTTTGCVNSNSVIVNYTPPAPNVTPNPVAMCFGNPAVLLRSSSSTTSVANFTSGTISVAIPEGNFPTRPATAATNVIAVAGIPANAVITGIAATLNATHGYANDIVAVLRSPSGAVINLDAIGGFANAGGANYLNTKFSSAGTTSIATGTAPFTGTWQADRAGVTFTAFGFTLSGGPVGFDPTTTSWATYFGTLGAGAANGNWTLAAYDAGAPDVGTLTKWDLEITYVVGVAASASTWSPIAGLFSDAAATIPYVAGTQVDSVWARPTTIGANNYQVTVNSAPLPDPTNASPIIINAAGNASPYPSVITASNYATTGVSVESVTLRGITHTWADDIDILLQSPTNQNVVLMSDIGGIVPIPAGTNYTFSDAGPAMNPGAVNPSGTYKPTNNGASDNWPAPGPGALTQAAPALSLFGNTANVNGDWKLLIFDDVGGDAGSVAGGWSIKLTPTSFCTSPARTVVVTVNQPVSIATQPVNATVCTDKVATFTAVAAGTSPTHNWQQSTNAGNTWTTLANGGVYSGVKTQTLTITAPPVSMNGYLFRDSVAGAAPCAAAFSNNVRLTVNPLPTVIISANPYTKLFPGLRTTISSTSSPAAATYTWRRNGAIVAGSTASTISVDVDGMGDYVLTVNDVNGCIGSSNTVTISDSASGKVFIYPNPNGGVFQVRYYASLNTRAPHGLNIYDSKGSRISANQYPNNAPYQRMDVDLRQHGKGIYWVEVIDVNGERLAVGRALVL